VKALILDVSPADLARRKRTGEDRWDESWEGVLHMSPAPSNEHQRMLDELLVFLLPLLRRAARGILRSGINVFRTDDDYRIPDLSFVASGREEILGVEGARGGPDAVIEIRSPGDETYDKFSFYAALAVREIIVIARDEKKCEVFRLAGSQYLAVSPDRDGFLLSETMGVVFGHEQGPRLIVQDANDRSQRSLV
jgi:Uma2 family endonuclease